MASGPRACQQHRNGECFGEAVQSSTLCCSHPDWERRNFRWAHSLRIISRDGQYLKMTDSVGQGETTSYDAATSLIIGSGQALSAD